MSRPSAVGKMVEGFDYPWKEEVDDMDEYGDYAKKLFEKMECYGINPDSDRKDQHFMICEDVISTVADIAHISEEDYVLEIGPGMGQLTEAILQKGAKLVSIEIDTRFEGVLGALKKEYGYKFDVIWGSALEVEWPEGINKIVMNPPFSILERLLELIYMQKSVEIVSMIIGKRYCENAIQKPGSAGFNKSTLMTQAKFDPAFVMNIKKEYFYPMAGEKCVVMSLTANKKPNPVLRVIADFFVNYPETNVKFVVNQVLDLLNKRARKYRKIENMITVRSLGIDNFMLERRLQDLSNSELARIVQRLTSKLNLQRKKPKEEDEW